MLLRGGLRLDQEFLRLGLVDELRLTVFPSVVGRGKPLFDVDRLPDNPDDMIFARWRRGPLGRERVRSFCTTRP